MILTGESFNEFPNSVKCDIEVEPVKLDDELNFVPQWKLSENMSQDQAIDVIGSTSRILLDLLPPAKVVNSKIVNKTIDATVEEVVGNKSKQIEERLKTKNGNN